MTSEPAGAHDPLRQVIETRLRTGLGLLVLPVAIIWYSLALLVYGLRGQSAASLHRFYLRFARLCIRIGGTRLEVHGGEHIDPDQAYVVVSNHESNWDPTAVIAGLPDLVIRFIVKQSLMEIPIFGRALRSSGNVKVVRSATGADIRRIREVMDRRNPDVSILFFAEGKRSLDGAFNPFKMGAFMTALGYGLPLLPVAVTGTRAIWPRGLLRLRPASVVIEIGKPISTEGLELDDRFALRDRAHASVSELRSRARAKLRARGFDPQGID